MAIEHNDQPSKATPRPAGSPGTVSSPPAGALADKGPGFSLGQRFSVGVNVAVMTVAAAALLVLVNWIASTRPVHRDWSTLGRYSLSPRTRAVVASVRDPITLTVVYGSQDPTKVRDDVTGTDYRDRVLELADEVKAAGKKVTVVDVAGADARAALAARLERSQQAAATGHSALLKDFLAARETLTAALDPLQAAMGDVTANRQAWLALCKQTDEAMEAVNKVKKELNDANNELNKLKTASGPLTAYEKQAEILKAALSSSFEAMDGSRKSFAQLKELAAKVGGDDGGVSKNTTAIGEQVKAEFAALIDAMGKPLPPATTQPAALFEPHFKKIAALLTRQGKLLSDFAKDQPAVTSFERWNVMLPVGGGMAMMAPLNMAFEDMTEPVGAISEQMSTDMPVGDFAKYLPDWIKRVRYVEALSTRLFAGANQLLADLKQIDPASQKFLAAADAAFDPIVTRLRELRDQADKLPAIKTAGLADKFKQENLLLVEVGKAAPVALDFNEVWPQVARPIQSEQDGRGRQTRRTFNGDAVVGSAIFSASSPPVAEAVFVHFTQPGNPMMQQPAVEGEIGLSDLTTLRDRLTKANVKVTEWNLAQGTTPPPPAHADDEESAHSSSASQPDKPVLPRVYVVLPPPPAPPQRDPQRDSAAQFGEQHRQAVTAAIANGGRALFLATWTMPQGQRSMFGPPIFTNPPYAWNDYLTSEWGVKVITDARLIQGIPTAEAGAYNVSGRRLQWMLCNRFNESHPVGKPLNNRRILLLDAAPIELTEKPEGVKQQVVMEVPRSDRTIFAMKHVENFRNRFDEGGPAVLRREPDDLTPPLNLLVEASRRDDAGDSTRIMVFSAGKSFIDFYLTGTVVRDSEEEGVRFDPPPDADAEILIDSVYYLAGQEKWIAAGPVAVPPINIADRQVVPVKLMVILAWPLLVALIGVAVVYVRRLR